MRRRAGLGSGILGALTLAAGWPRPKAAQGATSAVSHTDADWRALLSPAAYQVLRQQGTEVPFSSPLDFETHRGTYSCAGCALPLYSSATKYDSHMGRPSFWQPLPNAVAESADDSFGVQRTEAHCSRCGGHLGRVFPDGSKPTGLHLCMNGVGPDIHPAS